MSSSAETDFEVQRLKELYGYNILDTLSEKDYEDITFMASIICDVPVALISFVDNQRQWFKSHSGLLATETLREYSFCAHAINSSAEAMIIPDSRNDDRFKNNPLVTGDPNIVFYAGVPLITGNGYGLGTVCVIDTKPRELTKQQLDALKMLASQVMTLLEMRRNNIVLENTRINLEIRNEELDKASKSLRLALAAGKLGSYDLDIRSGKMIASLQCRKNYDIAPDAKFDFSDLLALILPEDISILTTAIENTIATNTQYEITYRIKTKDGKVRWIHATGLPTYDEEGKAVTMSVLTADVTIQKEAELKLKVDYQDQKIFSDQLELLVSQRTHELEQKNIELEKMNKELESFAYISSHDLQEPLRKIQSFSANIVASENHNLSDKGKDYFRRMQLSANRMQTLINDLLAYSRTATAEKVFKKANLNKIISEVKEDLKEEIDHKQALIEANAMCEVNIIPFQFRQLLQNLFTNALKFSRPGLTPVIKIKSETHAGAYFNNEKLSANLPYCHICISDNGIGFEKEYNDKIFELFQRLHGRSEYTGTGIGLSIVKKIVENHHGIITANGEPGVGATFDIYFPM